MEERPAKPNLRMLGRSHVVDMQRLADTISGPVRLSDLANSQMNQLAGQISPSMLMTPPKPAAPTPDQIKSFIDLPTKNLDMMLAELRTEMETLERTAQAIRDHYQAETERLVDAIALVKEAVRLGMETTEEWKTRLEASSGEEIKAKVDPGA